MTRRELATVVGANIAAERVGGGCKQAWLAGQVGITREALSRYENGHLLAPLDVLLRIAEALGCPVTAFLAGVVVVEEVAA